MGIVRDLAGIRCRDDRIGDDGLLSGAWRRRSGVRKIGLLVPKMTCRRIGDTYACVVLGARRSKASDV
jgi:hypothetical protein